MMKTLDASELSGIGRMMRKSMVSLVVLGVLLLWLLPIYGRYQTRANEANKIQVNELQIKQTEQLVQVERQKAQIRIVDAEGIAKSQQIINATLTDRYLQHEAIQAQLQMANSPNHTTIYIPSGNNGIPLVKTVDDTSAEAARGK
jgi:type II secretory pathway pseudopilin PulG